jgi:hypothetical protein
LLGGQRGRQGGCLVARQRLSHDDDVAVMRDHDLGEGAGRDAHDTGAAQLCRCVASDVDASPANSKAAMCSRPGTDVDLVVAAGWGPRGRSGSTVSSRR